MATIPRYGKQQACRAMTSGIRCAAGRYRQVAGPHPPEREGEAP